MSMPRAPQNASAQNGVGRLNTTLTVWASSLSTRSMSRYVASVHAEVAGSAAYSQLKTTSSAPKGLTPCHVHTPLRAHAHEEATDEEHSLRNQRARATRL